MKLKYTNGEEVLSLETQEGNGFIKMQYQNSNPGTSQSHDLFNTIRDAIELVYKKTNVELSEFINHEMSRKIHESILSNQANLFIIPITATVSHQEIELSMK